MGWNVNLNIKNNTKYNIDVVNNDAGQTGEIAPGGIFDWNTADPNNTNSLRFWDATVSPKTYYMQGGISFGPEAGVYVDRGWQAEGDQSVSATFCANGNCWTQTQNGGETLLKWNQFEGGGQITAVFAAV